MVGNLLLFLYKLYGSFVSTILLLCTTGRFECYEKSSTCSVFNINVTVQCLYYNVYLHCWEAGTHAMSISPEILSHTRSKGMAFLTYRNNRVLTSYIENVRSCMYFPYTITTHTRKSLTHINWNKMASALHYQQDITHQNQYYNYRVTLWLVNNSPKAWIRGLMDSLQNVLLMKLFCLIIWKTSKVFKQSALL